MKHIPFIALLCILFLGACQKEIGFGDGSNGNRKCISCSYLPLCDSSNLVYVDSSNTVDTLNGYVRIGTDTTINGLLYTQVTGFAAFPNGFLYNCANQDYKTWLKLSDFGVNKDSLVQMILLGIQLPIPIPPNLIQIPDNFKTSFLKAGLAVNATWTDTLYTLSFPPLLNIVAGLNYKILEKGGSRTVMQHTYNNIIHVAGKLNVVSTLPVNVPAYDVDYYFSRDVGIVEIQIRKAGVLTRDTRLLTYHL